MMSTTALLNEDYLFPVIKNICIASTAYSPLHSHSKLSVKCVYILFS